MLRGPNTSSRTSIRSVHVDSHQVRNSSSLGSSISPTPKTILNVTCQGSSIRVRLSLPDKQRSPGSGQRHEIQIQHWPATPSAPLCYARSMQSPASPLCKKHAGHFQFTDNYAANIPGLGSARLKMSSDSATARPPASEAVLSAISSMSKLT